MDRHEVKQMGKASSWKRIVSVATACAAATAAALLLLSVPALAAAPTGAEEAAKEAAGIDWVAIFKAISAALAVGITALATAWSQSRIGPAGCGAMAEKPEVSGTVFILVAIPETMVILGFVVAAMLILF